MERVRNMEQTTYRAERRTIYLGDIPLEVAMLPNGDYCLSQTQVAEVIGKHRNSMLRFFTSKHFKAMFDNGFECYLSEEKVYIEGSNKPINPISIDAACLYWQKWAVAGNKKAQQIGWALNKHSLYDLSDREFGIHRTDEARNQALREDLNSDPVDYLDSLEQEASNVLEFPSREASSEKELQLKIKLAELELQKIKSLEYAYDPSELKKLGTFSPEVLIYLKDKLKLKNWSEAEKFLEKVNFGQDSGKWVKVKISGEIDMLPRHSHWSKWAVAGNKKAQSLTFTLMQDGLRGISTFDFDVTRN